MRFKRVITKQKEIDNIVMHRLRARNWFAVKVKECNPLTIIGMKNGTGIAISTFYNDGHKIDMKKIAKKYNHLEERVRNTDLIPIVIYNVKNGFKIYKKNDDFRLEL